MEIRFYLRMLRRGWWLILVSVLVAVNVSLAFSYYFVTPLYESDARLIVSPNLQYIASDEVVNSIEALDNRSIVTTYSAVINSPQIISETYTLLGVNAADYIQYTTAVSVIPDTNIILFSVRGPDPQITTTLANSIGQHGIDFIKKLYVAFDIYFLDKAVVPTEPYYPQPLQNAGLALLIGVVVGAGLVIFRDMLAISLDRLSDRKKIDYESLAFSRTYFERLVRQEMTDNLESVQTLGFVYLNGVEEYYDSLPQAYINHIMRSVTDIMKNQLRGNDIIGRWSKLRFSFLLPSTDAHSASLRMVRIQKTLDEQISLEPDDSYHFELDPRIGLADRQGGEPFNVIVDQAEQALEISRQSDEKVNIYKVRPFG
jgi:capsular polysaccharide biosynthesis protein